MDITFKDSERQRKWTYTGLRRLIISKDYVSIMGWDDFTHENYYTRVALNEFDALELDKGEEGD